MEPLVSVIIPNYNGAQYIRACIESVENQDYQNMEIIVVDDGSTDHSLEILQKIRAEYENIIVLHQANLNASIARNHGMERAKGKYLLFLDSDDILYEGAVSGMVHLAEAEKADLVIGNYNNIDKNGFFIQNNCVIAESVLSTRPMEFAGTVPNPSNKLYAKSVIEDNKIVWGNVRIGQDLNFFLKYLSCCRSIAATTEYIYGWRMVKESISNTFNFRIFDITESFHNTKDFYVQRGKELLYEEYISVIEYRHYYLQMEKQKNFADRKARKVVIDYFSILLPQIDLSRCKNLDWYKSDIKKCRYKLKLRRLYVSKLYTWIDKKFARKSRKRS